MDRFLSNLAHINEAMICKSWSKLWMMKSLYLQSNILRNRVIIYRDSLNFVSYLILIIIERIIMLDFAITYS